MLKMMYSKYHAVIFLTGIVVLCCLSMSRNVYPTNGSDISQLVEQLRRDGQAVLKGAEFSTLPASVQGLIALGEPALPALSDLLHDDNAWVRWQAAWALKSLADQNLNIEPALTALRDCVWQESDLQLHYPCLLALRAFKGASPLAPIVVKTAAELVEALGSNREILLTSGDYLLDDLPQSAQGLMIENINNLKLIGRPDRKPVRIMISMYYPVVQIKNSRNVVLENLVIGHTEYSSEMCLANVLDIHDSDEISIAHTTLYGSGMIGLSLYKVQNLLFSDSTIKTCTEGIMELRASENIIFERAKFLNTRTFGNLILLENSQTVSYRDCTLESNRGTNLFSLTASDVVLQHSQIVGNVAASFVQTKDKGQLTAQKSHFKDNEFTSLLAPGTDPASFQEIESPPVEGD